MKMVIVLSGVWHLSFHKLRERLELPLVKLLAVHETDEQRQKYGTILRLAL